MCVCVSVSVTSPRRCEFSWLWWTGFGAVGTCECISKSSANHGRHARAYFWNAIAQRALSPSCRGPRRCLFVGGFIQFRIQPFWCKRSGHVTNTCVAGIFEPIWCRTQSQAFMDRISSYLFHKSNTQPTLSLQPHCKEKTDVTKLYIQQPKTYQTHDALSSAIQVAVLYIYTHCQIRILHQWTLRSLRIFLKFPPLQRQCPERGCSSARGRDIAGSGDLEIDGGPGNKKFVKVHQKGRKMHQIWCSKIIRKMETFRDFAFEKSKLSKNEV